MLNQCRIICLLTISLFSFCETFASGISRTTGIGIHTGFWWRSKSDLNISSEIPAVDFTSGRVNDVFFFSRLNEKLFLEATIGVNGGGKFEVDESDQQYVGTTRIIPIIFGGRRDFFVSQKYTSLAPYVSMGTGVYWITKSIQSKDTNSNLINEADIKFGYYFGGGCHFVLNNRIALNVDLKYHLVSFNVFNDFSGLNLGTGICLMWGKQQDVFQIKELNVLVTDIYPAYYSFYNSYPFGFVIIKNTSNYPIDVRVKSKIKDFSKQEVVSNNFRIESGKEKDVPIFVMLDSRLFEIEKRTPVALDIEVEATTRKIQRVSLSSQLLLHSRNAWTGEIDKLSSFVHPELDAIKEICSTTEIKLSDTTFNNNRNFILAKALFHELKQLGIRYEQDPNIPFYKDDYVQFPDETLTSLSGDCDDLVVLFASLLKNMGIHSAFVDVQNPEKNIAHVFLMFDSQLTPEESHLISIDERKFVTRNTSSNEVHVWIPVEMTLIEKGFNEAWQAGAREYFQNGIEANGLQNGWFRIIDVTE